MLTCRRDLCSMRSYRHLSSSRSPERSSYFFFNHPPPPDIYTLSLHDALPISPVHRHAPAQCAAGAACCDGACRIKLDRKSTRLNSSHQIISYAVFCLKKKKKNDPLSASREDRSLHRRLAQTQLLLRRSLPPQ